MKSAPCSPMEGKLYLDLRPLASESNNATENLNKPYHRPNDITLGIWNVALFHEVFMTDCKTVKPRSKGPTLRYNHIKKLWPLNVEEAPTNSGARLSVNTGPIEGINIGIVQALLGFLQHSFGLVKCRFSKIFTKARRTRTINRPTIEIQKRY